MESGVYERGIKVRALAPPCAAFGADSTLLGSSLLSITGISIGSEGIADAFGAEGGVKDPVGVKEPGCDFGLKMSCAEGV